MNVREEDRQKNSCPSRGLGLAAAAIGVGVGAALYYFFSKRPENPDGEGSTTGWSTERPHAFSTSIDIDTDIDDQNDSYTTISEHSTTDTSMEDETHNEIIDSHSDSSEVIDSDVFEDSESVFELNESMQSDSDVGTWNVTDSSTEVPSAVVSVFDLSRSDSDVSTEWDVTDSSVDLPSVEQLRAHIINTRIMSLSRYLSPRAGRTREQQERDQAFRERSWSLEECSICFDVILKDHKVTTLPCTHHFHSECITPWLQEQQTCPNCRKAAE